MFFLGSKGRNVTVCGKLHILVVFSFFENLGKSCGVDCDVNVRACLHADPFIFNPTLTLLAWVFGGGLLELPVHVVMWTSVQ